MPNLFVVRHAESTANVKNILAGQIDFPLTEKGRLDAQKIARELGKHTDVHLIYTSPLKRAAQTAEIFAVEFGNPPIIENRQLMEHNVGVFAGKTYDEIEHEKDYQHDKSKRWHWIPECGESYEMLSERVRDFFVQELSPAKKDMNILVVSHAVTMRLIRGLLENTLPEYPSEVAKNGEIWATKYLGLKQKHQIDIYLYDGTASFRA